MSDENKCAEGKEHNCVIKCECFRKFLIVALGTFVGVYLALSLFAYVHKTQMPCTKYPMVQHEMQMPNHHKSVENPFQNPHKHFKHHKHRNPQENINKQ